MADIKKIEIVFPNKYADSEQVARLGRDMASTALVRSDPAALDENAKIARVEIELEKGHGLGKFAGVLHEALIGVLGDWFGGIGGIDEQTVTLIIDVNTPKKSIEEAIEIVRTFVPPETPIPPEPSKQELRDQLTAMQQQLNALHDAIEKLSDKKEE